ncbi:KTSC domain-containing protein [Albibacterium profundi]|uniref:KTSC domain-containing protein n=1 Tax=Albibacterium profundi TaxID=3134906 RepID=A0ABV5CG03_9SPHI
MPSSVIDTISYDQSNAILKIRFQSGSVYEYMDVKKETYDAMRAAFSKGTFFNRHIKDKYEFSRIE